MAKQYVMIQRENDKGIVQNWQNANMEFDTMAGQVSFTPRGILGGKWTITLRPEQVSSFEIIMISDINTLGMMYGGGLLGYGIAWFMSRWVKLPALKLDQQVAPIGERTVSIRAAGFSPRKQTRDIAVQFTNLLTEKGAKVIMPDLSNEEMWKFPLLPVLAGCGLVIVALIVIFVLFAILASLGNN